MATATTAEMLDSMIKVDSTTRDLNINAAKSFIAGHLQLSGPVDDSTSENMKLAVVLVARNLILSKRNSRTEGVLEFDEILTPQIKKLIETTEDENSVYGMTSVHTAPTETQSWRFN